jgi:hypothetical protein
MNHLDRVARQLYAAARPLLSVTGNEANHCACCGQWGGADFDARDEHAEDCDLYAAAIAYRRAVSE